MLHQSRTNPGFKKRLSPFRTWRRLGEQRNRCKQNLQQGARRIRGEHCDGWSMRGDMVLREASWNTKCRPSRKPCLTRSATAYKRKCSVRRSTADLQSGWLPPQDSPGGWSEGFDSNHYRGVIITRNSRGISHLAKECGPSIRCLSRYSGKNCAYQTRSLLFSRVGRHEVRIVH